MNATGIPLKEPEVSAAAGDTEQLERAYIDASTTRASADVYTSAIGWLILGTLLAVSFPGSCIPLICLGHQFSYLGTGAPGSHEHHGLWLGLDGRNGHRHLVDGTVV